MSRSEGCGFGSTPKALGTKALGVEVKTGDILVELSQKTL
jgi:hypothetical protein